jgi:hypothetical protein
MEMPSGRLGAHPRSSYRSKYRAIFRQHSKTRDDAVDQRCPGEGAGSRHDGLHELSGTQRKVGGADESTFPAQGIGAPCSLSGPRGTFH